MNDIEQKLNSIKWENISIILTEKNEPILILLCKNEIESEKLYFLITKNPFTLNVYEDEKKGTYNFNIRLDNSEYTIVLETNLTLEKYPPIKFLLNKQIIAITSGYYDDNAKLLYNRMLHTFENNQLNLN